MNPSHRGFSLIEIVVVVFLASVAAIPIFSLLTENSRQLSFNSNKTKASILASQVLERFKNNALRDLVGEFPDFSQGGARLERDEILLYIRKEGQERFRREAKFEYFEDQGLGVLTCRVTWRAAGGKRDSTLERCLILRGGGRD